MMRSIFGLAFKMWMTKAGTIQLALPSSTFLKKGWTFLTHSADFRGKTISQMTSTIKTVLSRSHFPFFLLSCISSRYSRPENEWIDISCDSNRRILCRNRCPTATPTIGPTIPPRRFVSKHVYGGLTAVFVSLLLVTICIERYKVRELKSIRRSSFQDLRSWAVKCEYVEDMTCQIVSKLFIS